MITKTLPNLFTVFNLFLGIISIILSFNDRVDLAALMVILAFLTDGLDGKVARALKAQSDFGKELDSLSDIISFGVAPALIMYVSAFQYLGAAGWVVTAIFPIFGALRLARFNVISAPPGYFVGLPIPAAGGVLSTLALFQADLPNVALMLITIALSFMMVSRSHYPSFKKAGISNRIVWLVGTLLVAGAVFAHLIGHGGYAKFLLLPLALYAIYGLKKNVNIIFRRGRKRKRRNVEDPLDSIDSKI